MHACDTGHSIDSRVYFLCMRGWVSMSWLGVVPRSPSPGTLRSSPSPVTVLSLLLTSHGPRVTATATGAPHSSPPRALTLPDLPVARRPQKASLLERIMGIARPTNPRAAAEPCGPPPPPPAVDDDEEPCDSDDRQSVRWVKRRLGTEKDGWERC